MWVNVPLHGRCWYLLVNFQHYFIFTLSVNRLRVCAPDGFWLEHWRHLLFEWNTMSVSNQYEYEDWKDGSEVEGMERKWYDNDMDAITLKSWSGVYWSHRACFPLCSVGDLRGIWFWPVSFHCWVIVGWFTVCLLMNDFKLSAGIKCAIDAWMGWRCDRCGRHRHPQQWLVMNFYWEIRFSDDSDSFCIEFEGLLWWEVSVIHMNRCHLPFLFLVGLSSRWGWPFDTCVTWHCTRLWYRHAACRSIPKEGWDGGQYLWCHVAVV